jgi:hypothetical protein
VVGTYANIIERKASGCTLNLRNRSDDGSFDASCISGTPAENKVGVMLRLPALKRQPLSFFPWHR